MANTVAYYTTQLTTIDAKIDALLANPRPDYKVGNTSMNYAGLLKTLYEIREKILAKISSLDSESFETLNTDVNQFGQDIADYLNEENA